MRQLLIAVEFTISQHFVEYAQAGCISYDRMEATVCMTGIRIADGEPSGSSALAGCSKDKRM
jgi:hypothetical protein